MAIKIPMRKITLFILVFLFCTTSSDGGLMDKQFIHYENLSNVPDHVWQKLSNMQIYFGHQSVGYDIIDGIEQILKENKTIHLKIQEAEKPEKSDSAKFYHSKVGRNRDPKSKLDAFISYINSSGGKNSDISFFKYCYIDFDANTKIENIINDYITAFKSLKQRYPDTIFIHFTVPLTTIQSGPKAWVKSLLGKHLGGVKENIKRNLFNKKLKEIYKGHEPIFDLAKIESTYPNGNRSIFKDNELAYYSLVPEYTSDGGHLNEVGKRVVAEKLLLFLAGLI